MDIDVTKVVVFCPECGLKRELWTETGKVYRFTNTVDAYGKPNPNPGPFIRRCEDCGTLFISSLSFQSVQTRYVPVVDAPDTWNWIGCADGLPPENWSGYIRFKNPVSHLIEVILATYKPAYDIWCWESLTVEELWYKKEAVVAWCGISFQSFKEV